MSVPGVRVRLLRELLLCGIFLAGCTGDPESAGPMHPRADLLVRPIPASGVLRLGEPSSGAKVDSLLSLRIPHPEIAAIRIGRFDGPESQVFGKIQSAVVDEHDRVLALDAHARQLRVFDERGHALQILGRGGEGPAEFSFPRAVDLAHDGRIFVFDAWGRISIFQAGEDSIRYSHSLHIDGGMYDGCVMNGRLYVHGMMPGGAHALQTYAGGVTKEVTCAP